MKKEKKAGKKGMKVGDYSYVVVAQGLEHPRFYRTWQQALDDGMEDGDTVYIVEIKSKQQAKLTLR